MPADLPRACAKAGVWRSSLLARTVWPVTTDDVELEERGGAGTYEGVKHMLRSATGESGHRRAARAKEYQRSRRTG